MDQDEAFGAKGTADSQQRNRDLSPANSKGLNSANNLKEREMDIPQSLQKGMQPG